MSWKPREWILIGMLLCLFTAASMAQVATTTVADTIYYANGVPAAGTVLISWPAFTTAAGEAIASGSTSVTLGANGTLSVSLTPNSGATPIGTYYTAVFHLADGTVSHEYWVVPTSAAPVKVATIETTVLPTTVAMQTVSKAYVDTAIAAATSGHPLDSTPYVLKAGDSMTGPLNLPGDPVSSTQAADKNYVDESVAGVTSGLGQKVSTLPAGTQVVTQPSGTDLEVNRLNGVQHAEQFVTGRGGNGIANVVASPDCASGCQVQVDQSYNSTEPLAPMSLPSGTHVTDERGGAQVDTFFNSLQAQSAGVAVGEHIDHVVTQDTVGLVGMTGTATPSEFGLYVTQEALAGGSNMFPEGFEQAPYFKTAYNAMQVKGVYNTQGQHGLFPEEIDCFGVGDCLMGSRFIRASGGWRDNADEGAHLYDTTVQEDDRVFVGACVSGCTTGSQTLQIREDSGGGTQGDGRFLIDTNPAKMISSQTNGGAIIGGSPGPMQASVRFSGTNFPVSVFLANSQVIPSQVNNQAPGTVTFAIATTGVPAGFATNTGAIGNSSGVACMVDQISGAANYFEIAPYTVVDGTHLQMTLNKPHEAMSTIAFGGLCGYGIEQTVDTMNGIRQLFPVIGAYSPTALYYVAKDSAVLGQMNQTDGFVNVNAPIVQMTRSGGVVSVVLGVGVANVNGLTATISGATDSTFNGSFAVTMTGNNTFSYAQSGPDSTTTGGTVSVLTGGYAMYPMAEVLSVFNPATKNVDGYMQLAPNNVPWAANDSVEQPHFYQEVITPDTDIFKQSVPRPTLTQRPGILYQGNNSAGMTGWSIQNGTPAGFYLGYGGTHNVPDAAYESLGLWRRTMNLSAGEQSVFSVHCNGHGCANWNSGYNLFELDNPSGADVISYAPQTRTLTVGVAGSAYTYGPSGFTANTINVNTLNANAINGPINAAGLSGTVAASALPVFGPSGASHGAGAVPDPGATAGSSRFLREDGTWATPAGGGSGGGATGTAAITGGTIDGTVIGGSTPAAVSATTLNSVPVSEYTNVARKPMTNLLQALHNAANQAVNIVVLGDSFSICDYVNCNTGPTTSTNRYTEQLRINLQAQYGSHGTGMVPLVGIVGPTINNEEWSINGTWSTVNTLGPYQQGNVAGSSLVHLSNGEVATFTSAIPYDTINTYCMTTPSTGSIAVAIDGVAVGSACNAATAAAQARVATSSTVALGTHVTTFTSTGDSYLYAAEGSAGSTGVSVHNVAVGSAAAEWFGLNPTTQLAFSDLIPTGTQGVVTMLQTNEPGVGYNVQSFTSAMNAIISHEQGLVGAPSVLMVVPPVDVINGTAPFTAAQISIAQQQNVGFVNIQDRWGTAYVPSSGLWDLGTTATGIHPNDKGARDMYSMVYAGLVDPVPFGTTSTTTASSISGLISAGTGVTISGSGTTGSPYTIAATAGGGGCTANCTLTGTTTLNSGTGGNPLAMTSGSSIGTYFTMGGTGTGVHTWGFHSYPGADGADFLIGDFTVGSYPFALHYTVAPAGYIDVGQHIGYCWAGNDSPSNAGADTCLGRGSAGNITVGNGTPGDASGSVSAAMYKGPATAPTGACTVVGWAFSQDGHISFCNGSAWATKM